MLADGVGSVEENEKLEAMLDDTLAAEGAQLDPVPEGVNAPPTAIPDVIDTPQGLAGESVGERKPSQRLARRTGSDRKDCITDGDGRVKIRHAQVGG